MQLLRGRTTGMRQLVISPDGRYLVGGASTCNVWDLHDPKPRPRAVPTGEHGNWGLDVRFLNATQLFVRAAQPPGWYRHDIETGETTDLMRPLSLSRDNICLHPSGELLKASSWLDAGSPNQIASYRVQHGKLDTIVADTHRPVIEGVFGFTPTGKHYLAQADLTGDPACKYHLFDTATDAVVTTFERPPGYRTYHGTWCFSPDGRQLYVAVDWWLMRYECATGGLHTASLKLAKNKTNGNIPLAAHPDGRQLATVEDGRAVTFRDADTLQVIRTYDFAMPTVTCVAFTPDGTRCVIGNSRGKVLLFDVE